MYHFVLASIIAMITSAIFKRLGQMSILQRYPVFFRSVLYGTTAALILYHLQLVERIYPNYGWIYIGVIYGTLIYVITIMIPLRSEKKKK